MLDSKSDESFVSPSVKDIYYEIWTSENPKVPETDPNYKEKKAEATKKYIINMMNSGSFMGYLYSIGVELDFIKLDSIDVGTGVSFDVVKGVLTKYIEKNEYINKYVSVSAKNLKDFNNNENDLRNAVIAKLKKGQPVILGGGTKSGGGHDTVAYYYDEENDIIYWHNGWKNSSNKHNNSFHNLDDMFEYYADFFYIEVISGLNHTHNKYFKIYYSSTTYNYYCNCELDSHICGFYDFSYGDKNYYVHQCLCEFKYVLHEFERVTTDTKRCKYCRMMISEPSKEN